MKAKHFKTFMLFFLFFLSYHFFSETIVYAEQQASTLSQKTNDMTSLNSENEKSSENVSKDDSTNTTSTSKLNEDSKNSADNENNDTATNVLESEEQKEETKEEEFISHEWKTINNKKYYIVDNKILERTGWFMEKDVNPDITPKDENYDSKYYLDADFSVVVGWKKIRGSWYYFNSEGIMQKGWILDNSWYYTNDKGVMQKDWQEIDGYTYYFNQYGQMAIYKRLINNNWYFFNSKGQLQKGFYNYNDKKYYSDKDGIMVVNEWVNTKKHKYYIKADSSVAIGSLYLNGVMENFNSNGYYEGSDKNDNNYLFVQYLNVGNADCAFIRLPSGETVLIDTGDTTTSKTLINFLNNQNLKTEFFQSNNKKTSDIGQVVKNNINRTANGKGVIDYVVLTHPHSDHIGGMIELMKNFNIGKIFIPKYFEMKDFASGLNDTTYSKEQKDIMSYDYKVYKETIDAINKNGISLTEADTNSFIDSENFLQFIQANKDYPSLQATNLYQEYALLNNNSAIVYLNYYDLQGLFAGDIEWGAENDFFNRKALNEKEVDVLKVPHHGNSGSSSYIFIEYVKPTIGVISRAKESVSTDNAAYNTLTTYGVSLYETSSNKNGISLYSTKDNWNIESGQ